MGLLSGLNSLFGGGDKQQNVTSTQAPLSALEDPFNRYGYRLSELLTNPGQTFNPYYGNVQAQPTQQYWQGVSALAQPYWWDQSQQYFNNAAQGNYLGLTPEYQQAVINPAVEAVNNRFNALGRFGSQQNVQGATKAAFEALTPYYAMERGLQQQAAAALPGLQTGKGLAQIQAGQYGQAGNQVAITNRMAQQAQNNFNPNYATLQAVSGLLGAGNGYGTTTQQTQIPGGSPLAGALGTGLALAGIYSGFGGAGLLGGGGAAAGGAGAGGLLTGYPAMNGINAMFPGYGY